MIYWAESVRDPLRTRWGRAVRLFIGNVARRVLEWAEGPDMTATDLLQGLRGLEREIIRDVVEDLRLSGNEVNEVAPGIWSVQASSSLFSGRRSRRVH